MPEYDTCPATGKRKFATKGLANAALREHEASEGWEDKPTRRSWCKLCNGGHLTSQEPFRDKRLGARGTARGAPAVLVNPTPGSAR
jgi:hypothetical protein